MDLSLDTNNIFDTENLKATVDDRSFSKLKQLSEITENEGKYYKLILLEESLKRSLATKDRESAKYTIKSNLMRGSEA